MALRTVSALGGNWNATTAWAGGVIPLVGDTVDFTATSGNLVVNVATANLAGIDFTNYVGTITFNAAISTNGAINLGTGGYTQAGASGLVLTSTATITSNGTVWSRNLTFSSANITYTLADTLSTTGTVSLSGTTTTILNGNTLNIGGTLTTTTSAVTSGTTAIVFNGASCAWSNISTGALRNNATINTAGTLTISGTVRYDTGIFTYTAGTVTTTGSTLITNASTTFDTVGMSWNNVTFGGTSTMTLTTNMTLAGTLLIQTNAVTVNGASRTLYVGGSLTVNQALSGTATIELTGTGTWSTTGYGVQNNLIFNNGANSFTVSGAVYYGAGTMTYTSGTIVTTGSTLLIFSSCTLNTNGITWADFLPYNTLTITLLSTFNCIGVFRVGQAATSNISFSLGVGATLNPTGSFLYTNSNAVTLNLPNAITVTNATIGTGSGWTITLNNHSMNITGNMVINHSNGFSYAASTGTTTYKMTGTGTLGTSATNAFGIVYSPIEIDTAGTVTLSNRFEVGGAFTYTNGTFLTSGASAILFVGTSSLNNCNSIYWDNTVYTGYNFNVLTINSNFNAKSFIFGGVGTVSGTGVINCGTLAINNSLSGASNVTATLNVDVYVSGNTTFGPGPGGDFQINGGKTIFVGGDLSMTAATNIYGSTIIRMVGTGTISSAANWRQLDLIIDTPGNINITSILYWNLAATAITAKTIAYLRGNVTVAKTAGLYIGNLNATFTNMHRIPWPTVTITAGQTITLNEFFSGTGNYKTVVQSSSTSAYTISFTDNFEKTTKFVEVSNCTLTRPNQLIVAGDCRAKGSNRGIRYTNQSPNGLPKNLGKTKPSMTFDTGGLVPDPNFVKLK